MTACTGKSSNKATSTRLLPFDKLGNVRRKCPQHRRMSYTPCSLPSMNTKDRVTLDQSNGIQCQAVPPDAEPTPFFEPLVRCFLLGVISGGLFESYSVLSTMADVSTQTANVWNLVESTYSPQFVKDHVLAICLMLVFYASESALMGPHGPLRNSAVAYFMAKLPKTILPLNFTALTDLWMRLSSNNQLESSGVELTPKQPIGAAPGMAAPTVKPGMYANTSANVLTQTEAPFVEDRAARPGLTPGQWDPAQGGAAELEMARQTYLEGMYYCVATVPAQGLQTNQVYSAYLMGTRVAYWKDENDKIQMISSTCTHRGAQLANGWIDSVNGETCVRCPYHAWAFNGDGTVKNIPVQPEGGYPKRPLQQAFDTRLQGGRLWVFWGRPQIPSEERPPVPGVASASLGGMMSEHAFKDCEVPHHATFEVLASESTISNILRMFLGINDSKVIARTEVDPSWTSRTVNYKLSVSKQKLSPLVPRGTEDGTLSVTVSAQIPSSVVTTIHLPEGQRLSIEAHVHPQTFSSSSVTISLHRNFATWPAAGLLIRDKLDNLAEGVRGRAEGLGARKVKKLPPFLPARTSEVLIQSFTSLRSDFNKLGYGIPAEIAASPDRLDM